MPSRRSSFVLLLAFSLVVVLAGPASACFSPKPPPKPVPSTTTTVKVPTVYDCLREAYLAGRPLSSCWATTSTTVAPTTTTTVAPTTTTTEAPTTTTTEAPSTTTTTEFVPAL